MIFLIIPSEIKESVTGEWGNYAISPRLMLNGDFAVNPRVLDIPTLPSDVRQALSECALSELSAEDFPPDEELENNDDE